MVMPFVSKEHADKLFLAFIEEGGLKEDFNVVTLAPFVSDTCLDKFVDQYLEGHYQHVNVDLLYPFMDSKTVKKLFKYILSKKESN